MTNLPLEHNCDYVTIINPTGTSPVVLVCEHASSHIPESYNALGLSAEDQVSHVAWDPGAFGVSEKLSDLLDATLVASGASRLLYDCNRPSNAVSAMPTRSEFIDIPGNKNLTEAEKLKRIKLFYEPFCEQLHKAMIKFSNPILVTVHSFTPIFYGKRRTLEIGILNDSDTRLADALLDISRQEQAQNIQRNAPYGPKDGVTHTLKKHAIANGHLNVMLEIRNDLIISKEQQNMMASKLAKWIQQACIRLNTTGDLQFNL